jgi:hypothetical protein
MSVLGNFAVRKAKACADPNRLASNALLPLYVSADVQSGISSSKLLQASASVLKNEPVPRHTLLEVHNGLVGILHRPLVDPRVDVLIRSKLQHLPDLRRGTDETAADLDLLQDESESHELGDGVLRRADLDELATDVEQAEVAVDGQAGTGDGADDQVEGVGVLLLVTLLGGGNEVVGTHLERIFLLGVGAADGDDLVSAQGLGPEETKVAKTANTDDTNALAGPAAVLLEGRVEGDTAAKHGRGLSRGHSVGDGEDEVVVSAPVLGVSTV